VWARTALGIVLEIQQHRGDAKKQYEDALSLNPNAGVAANNLASIYADTNERLDMALELAQTAVRQMPEVGAASDTLGWVHFKRNTPWLAVSPLRRAAQLEPNNPLYQYHLGLSYEKMGDKINARASLERALNLGKFENEADARRLLASL
jgi:Flp pilus assembly protein TadD